jgi:DNA-binding IclR family transcriptional regulator
MIVKKPDSRASSERRKIKSIEVGFRTIRVLEQAKESMTLSKISTAAKMPLSKAYIYLQSYVAEGLVNFDQESGHYSLGPFALQLGFAAVRHMDIVPNARDAIYRLRSQTGYSVTLSCWGNRGPTIIFKADGVRQGALGVNLGYVSSPTRSASGQVFLAFLPRAITDHVVMLEQKTRPEIFLSDNIEAIRAELEPLLVQVRATGTSTSAHSGYASSAAPIYDYTGSVVASLGILSPLGRFSSGAQRRLTVDLLSCVGEISERMGWTKESGETEPARVALTPSGRRTQKK